MTFSSNGTIKGNIEVTNNGDFVSVSKGNKGTSAQGQGVVTTKDGSEKANYTTISAIGKQELDYNRILLLATINFSKKLSGFFFSYPLSQ